MTEAALTDAQWENLRKLLRDPKDDARREIDRARRAFAAWKAGECIGLSESREQEDHRSAVTIAALEWVTLAVEREADMRREFRYTAFGPDPDLLSGLRKWLDRERHYRELRGFDSAIRRQRPHAERRELFTRIMAVWFEANGSLYAKREDAPLVRFVMAATDGVWNGGWSAISRFARTDARRIRSEADYLRGLFSPLRRRKTPRDRRLRR